MKPEKTGRRCVLILLILLAAVFFLSFLLGRYRVSALQTARLLADRALSGVSRGHRCCLDYGVCTSKPLCAARTTPSGICAT